MKRTYYVVKVLYVDEHDNKKKRFTVLTDAASYTEAEEMTYQKFEGYRDLTVKGIKTVTYDDFIGEGERFYVVKVLYDNIDDKPFIASYLLCADDFAKCYKMATERFCDDYEEIISIAQINYVMFLSQS